MPLQACFHNPWLLCRTHRLYVGKGTKLPFKFSQLSTGDVRVKLSWSVCCDLVLIIPWRELLAIKNPQNFFCCPREATFLSTIKILLSCSFNIYPFAKVRHIGTGCDVFTRYQRFKARFPNCPFDFGSLVKKFRASVRLKNVGNKHNVIYTKKLVSIFAIEAAVVNAKIVVTENWIILQLTVSYFLDCTASQFWNFYVLTNASPWNTSIQLFPWTVQLRIWAL